LTGGRWQYDWNAEGVAFWGKEPRDSTALTGREITAWISSLWD